jgi:hypothetical protein
MIGILFFSLIDDTDKSHENDQEENVATTSKRPTTAICKHCNKPGHKMKRSVDCDKNPVNLANKTKGQSNNIPLNERTSFIQFSDSTGLTNAPAYTYTFTDEIDNLSSTVLNNNSKNSNQTHNGDKNNQTNTTSENSTNSNLFAFDASLFTNQDTGNSLIKLCLS